MLDGVAEGLEGRCDWWFFDYFMVFLRLFFFFHVQVPSEEPCELWAPELTGAR